MKLCECCEQLGDGEKVCKTCHQKLLKEFKNSRDDHYNGNCHEHCGWCDLELKLEGSNDQPQKEF